MFGFRKRPPKYDPAERLAAIDWAGLTWVFLTSWTGGPQNIAPGFDVGAAKWQPVIDPASRLQRQIEGVDGVYGERHHLRVWFVEMAGDIRLFAADEVSNGVWLVFVPAGSPDEAKRNPGPV